MKQEEYNVLLKELDSIKEEWENKDNLSKLDVFRIYLKYLLFNIKVRLKK